MQLPFSKQDVCILDLLMIKFCHAYLEFQVFSLIILILVLFIFITG